MRNPHMLIQIEELTEKVSVQEKDIIKLETEISTSTSLGMKRYLNNLHLHIHLRYILYHQLSLVHYFLQPEKDIIKLETEISTSTSLGMKRIQTKTESEGSFGKNEEEDIEIREVSVKEIKSEENSLLLSSVSISNKSACFFTL